MHECFACAVTAIVGGYINLFNSSYSAISKEGDMVKAKKISYGFVVKLGDEY